MMHVNQLEAWSTNLLSNRIVWATFHIPHRVTVELDFLIFKMIKLAEQEEEKENKSNN